MGLDIEVIVQRFLEVASLAGVAIPREAIKVERLAAPHDPGPLPWGWMAVYVFIQGERVLKVGKAGPQSNARYQSQHYRAASSNSNLSKSLVQSGERVGIARLTGDTAGTWIRRNTERINI